MDATPALPAAAYAVAGAAAADAGPAALVFGGVVALSLLLWSATALRARARVPAARAG